MQTPIRGEMKRAAQERHEGLLFRGSVVARGAQSLLIVGDTETPTEALAIALLVHGFEPVCLGMAMLDGRSLAPLPGREAFSLMPSEIEALSALPGKPLACLESLSTQRFQPYTVLRGAPEPTHLLFPERHAGSLTVVRPVSTATARSRLYHALVAAPEDQSPFASIAALLRHARGIHITLGDLARAVEQLEPILPRWEPTYREN